MGDTMGRPLPDIIIPTCRSSAEVAPLVCELEGYSWPCRVHATCQPVSAAQNRNLGLAWAQSDIVFMCDDDTQGYYPDWWEPMARILRDDPGVCMVSARLLKPDGSPGLMMFPGETAPPISYVPRLPTACVAFWREGGIAFDEEYIGSGYEDDDFCALLHQRHPRKRFAICNGTRIIHVNEQKHQGGRFWEHNRAHFYSKWRETRDGLARADRYWNIPYVLHVVWVGPDEMPDWARQNIERWLQLNPGLRVVYHGERDLLDKWRLAYADIHGPHEWERKSDLIRLSVLCRDGGWYADADFLPLRPLIDICNDHEIRTGAFVTRANADLLANGFIGLAPQSQAAQLFEQRVDWLIEHVVTNPHWERGEEKEWGMYGPGLVTFTLDNGAAPCVTVGDERMFYPVPDPEEQRAVDAYRQIRACPTDADALFPWRPYLLHLHQKGRRDLLPPRGGSCESQAAHA